MTSSIVVPTAGLRQAPVSIAEGENASLRVLRVLLLFGLFSLMFLPEYVQGDHDSTSKSWLYGTAFGGLRYVDVLLLILIAIHAGMLCCGRRLHFHFPRTAAGWLACFGLALMVSLGFGAANGGRNLFFDWRALALGVGLYFVYLTWLSSGIARSDATFLFLAFCTLRVIAFAIEFGFGGGTQLLGVRTPLFDGPTLSILVCASLLSLALAGRTQGAETWMFLLLGMITAGFVVLCFRRTYWAELAIGTALLLVFSPGRSRIALAMVGALAAGLFVLGPNAIARVRSFDITAAESEFSGDNADHVGDVVDAWQEAKASPLMGVGLGRSYPTWAIRNWKDESVMVHNAPLHVWLKYGILGLLSYVGFHLSLFRSLQRRWHRPQAREAAVVTAVLCYLAAQFVVSLGFSPWPHSAIQSTSQIAFLLALTLGR